MTDLSINRDTVVIDEAVHEIYKQLTEGNDPISTPFRTMKDVFMWAAILGFRRGNRRTLVGKRITIFRWAQFTSKIDLPMLKALAITDSKDLNVLLNQDEILTCAEEYANAGIHELRASLLDNHGYPLWNLIEIVPAK